MSEKEKAQPPAEQAALTRIYHVDLGISEWMHKIDAAAAVSRHPGEWSVSPWPEKAAEAAPAAGKGSKN